MSERVSYTLQARRTGIVATIYVDAHKVASQTCHTHEYAQAWCQARIEELKRELVRQ